MVLLLFFVRDQPRSRSPSQVSYVLFEVPSNLVLARVRPSLYLSGLCILWGGVAACMAATNNWKQLAAVRFCLGVVEAGFAPGVTFYLSSWYKRYELSRRYSIYYTATAISGAFSGLLAGLIVSCLVRVQLSRSDSTLGWEARPTGMAVAICEFSLRSCLTSRSSRALALPSSGSSLVSA